MALTYREHKFRFGPSLINVSASNTEIGSIDLAGNDLLAGSSGNSLYMITTRLLVYNANGNAYPMSFYYDGETVENRSGTYTIHTGGAAIKALTGVVTINFAITSTSFYTTRASNSSGGSTWAAVGWQIVRMYNV
jgi:hypothetical protein